MRIAIFFDGEEFFIPDSKAEQLLTYGEAGAVAGLLCEQTTTRQLYWCDWGNFRQRTPSICWTNMLAIGPSSHAVRWRLIRDGYGVEIAGIEEAGTMSEGTLVRISATRRRPLIDCPFCGSSSDRENLFVLSNQIVCDNCGANGPEGSSKSDAAEKWNGRAQAKGGA